MSQEEDTAFLFDDVVSPTVIPTRLTQATPRRRTTDVTMSHPVAHRTQSCAGQTPATDPLQQEPDSLPDVKPPDQPEEISQMPSPTPVTNPTAPLKGPPMSIAFRPLAAIDGPLDFTNKVHVSIYKEMLKELPDTYDGSTETLRDFLAHVQHRANNSNWTNMVTITTLNASPVNLIIRHGLVTMSQVRQHAAAYWFQPSRNTQNSTAMYTAIYDSLKQPLLSKVNNQIDECLAIPSNEDSRDGPLLLKLILTIVQVDTGATVINLHDKLTAYHEQISNMSKFNVKTFNKDVTTIMNDLEARRQTCFQSRGV